MKNFRRFFVRTILGIMAGLLLSTGGTAHFGTGSRDQSSESSSNVQQQIAQLGKRGTRLNINYDLRSRSGWKYNDCGKNVSMKTVLL